MFKAKKIICIAFSVVFIFSLSVFSVSAETGKYIVENNLTLDDVHFQSKLNDGSVSTLEYIDDGSMFRAKPLAGTEYIRFYMFVSDTFNSVKFNSGDYFQCKFDLMGISKVPIELESVHFVDNTGKAFVYYLNVDFTNSYAIDSYSISYSLNINTKLNIDLNGINSIIIQYKPKEILTVNQYFRVNLFSDITVETGDELWAEKQEGNSVGNDSIDSLTSAIPVETDGLLNAFGNLKNSMLHTSTECKIDFPAIKTPAILGVIPEYTLYEGGQVDFEQSVELLPEALLLLVRALLTIALILCCFKELYDTISYVLTLKKGGGE